MTDIPYASPNPTDTEHLRILSICHFVLAGIAAFFSCIPIIHVCIGLMLVFGGPSMGGSGSPPPASFGWIFVIMGTAAILIGWICALLIFLAGRSIKQRRHYTFCLVVAGIACLWMPFGTVLGVFSFIVLLRPSVKGMFIAA
jgi:hypothetical protein